MMIDKKEVERWYEMAREVDVMIPRAKPVQEVVDEAKTLADLASEYWEPLPERPGLKQAGARLPQHIVTDILTLAELIEDADQRFREALASDNETQTVLDRGRVVLDELTAVLDWHFGEIVVPEPNIPEPQETKAATLNYASRLASSLREYANLAKVYADELHGMASFEKETIDEAERLSQDLDRLAGKEQAQYKEALEMPLMRERLATLLQARVRILRGAVRLVFRNHPDILAQSTGVHWGRERIAERRTARVQAMRRGRRTQPRYPSIW